jgi:hypothetical protein
MAPSSHSSVEPTSSHSSPISASPQPTASAERMSKRRMQGPNCNGISESTLTNTVLHRFPDRSAVSGLAQLRGSRRVTGERLRATSRSVLAHSRGGAATRAPPASTDPTSTSRAEFPHATRAPRGSRFLAISLVRKAQPPSETPEFRNVPRRDPTPSSSTSRPSMFLPVLDRL